MYLGWIRYGSLQTRTHDNFYDREQFTHLRREGERIEVLSMHQRRYVFRLLQNDSPLLRERLLHTPFDVLLQDERNHASLFVLNRWLRKRVDYPIISIVHSLHCMEKRPFGHNFFYRQIERSYLKSVDGYVLSSQLAFEHVSDLTGDAHPSIVISPARGRFGKPLLREDVAARVRRGGMLRVLFTGGLTTRSGLHTLVDALAQLPATDWALVVAGSQKGHPGRLRRMKKKLADLGLSERVKFYNSPPDEQVKSFFIHSDILVVPSCSEGVGTVYLERMAFGLPAFAVTNGLGAEYITHGQDGYLFTPGDSAMLAQYLRRLISNPVRLLAMSLAALDRYQQAPSWGDSTLEMLSFLRRQRDDSFGSSV